MSFSFTLTNIVGTRYRGVRAGERSCLDTSPGRLLNSHVPGGLVLCGEDEEEKVRHNVRSAAGEIRKTSRGSLLYSCIFRRGSAYNSHFTCMI